MSLCEGVKIYEKLCENCLGLVVNKAVHTLRRKLQTKNVWLPATKLCTVVDFCAVVVVFLRLARTVK